MKKIALVLVIMLGISSPALAGSPFIQEILSGIGETNSVQTVINGPEGNIFILTDIIATTRADTGNFLPFVGVIVDGEFVTKIRLHINLSIEGPSKSWHFQSGIPFVGNVGVFADQDYINGFITVSGYLIDAD